MVSKPLFCTDLVRGRMRSTEVEGILTIVVSRATTAAIA